MRPEIERAALSGDVASLEEQLISGVAVDSRDRHGQTALMLAAHHGRPDVVTCLVRHGADLNVTAKYGLSALMLAIVAGHEEVARTLVHAGADLKIRGTGAPGFSGKNAHDLAAEQGMNELCGEIAARVSFDRQPTLVGELVELRPLRAADFDALFGVAKDPLIWEQHPDRERYQEPTFRAFFQEALKSGGALVALERATGQIIGSSRYHGYDAEDSVIEIGWTFLARAYWGGRYNGEMTRLMLDHAFRSVARVIFVIGPENRRSQRAVEKLGGVCVGDRVDDRGRKQLVYELTPASYALAQRHRSDR
jgi:N-acetyltransferase